jgi:hypothetical protein
MKKKEKEKAVGRAEYSKETNYFSTNVTEKGSIRTALSLSSSLSSIEQKEEKFYLLIALFYLFTRELNMCRTSAHILIILRSA